MKVAASIFRVIYTRNNKYIEGPIYTVSFLMGKGEVMMSSVYPGYIATIDIWKNAYEMYLGVVCGLHPLVIAVGCAIIDI